MTINKMIVVGNVGSDPEMRYTPNGNPVTSFSVATNRRWNSADGEAARGNRVVPRQYVEPLG